MKDITRFSGQFWFFSIFVLLLFVFTFTSSYPQKDQIDEDPDYDYGLEEDAQQESVKPLSISENQIVQFIDWAEKMDKIDPVPRIPTTRPSPSEIADNQDQALGAINSRSLKCASARGCNNCYKYNGDMLIKSSCPNYSFNENSNASSNLRPLFFLFIFNFLNMIV